MDDWGAFLNAVSLFFSVIGIGLAGWSIHLAVRGEGLLRGTKAVADRLTVMSRIERLTALGAALGEVLAFDSAATGGPDVRRAILMTNFIAAANACDSDMRLPKTAEFVTALQAAGGGRAANSPLTPDLLKGVDGVQKEVLSGLDAAWTQLNPPA